MAWFDKFKPGDTIKSRNTICMDDGVVHTIHRLDGDLYVKCRGGLHSLWYHNETNFYPKEPTMNTLAIINLARRYAKNIVAKNFPDLTKAEATRKAKELAESKRLRALARINWTKANAKKVSA